MDVSIGIFYLVPGLRLGTPSTEAPPRSNSNQAVMRHRLNQCVLSLAIRIID
jgi:hypothetical protein